MSDNDFSAMLARFWSLFSKKCSECDMDFDQLSKENDTTELEYGEDNCKISSALWESSQSESLQSESELLSTILSECGADEIKSVPASKVIKVLQRKCQSDDQNEILSALLKIMEESDEMIDCSSLQAILYKLKELIDDKIPGNRFVHSKDHTNEEGHISSDENLGDSDCEIFTNCISTGPCTSYFYDRRRSIAEFSEDVKNIWHQNKKLNMEKVMLEKQIRESDDVHHNIIQENEELKKAMKRMEKGLLEKNKELQIQNEDLKVCLQSSEDAKNLCDSKLDASLQEKNALETHLKNIETKYQQVQAELSSVKKRGEILYTALTEQKQHSQNLLEEKNLLHDKLIEQNAQNERTKQTMEDLVEINKVLQQEKAEWEKRCSILLAQNAKFLDNINYSSFGSGEPLQQCSIASVEIENLNDEIIHVPQKEILSVSSSNQSLNKEMETVNFDSKLIKEEIQNLKAEVSKQKTVLQYLVGNNLNLPSIMESNYISEYIKESDPVTYQQNDENIPSKENATKRNKNNSHLSPPRSQARRSIPSFPFRCEVILLLFIIIKLFIYSYFHTSEYKQYYASMFEKSLEIILWPILKIQNEKPPI